MEKFEQVLTDAVDAFFTSVASSYPEVKSGDLAPDQIIPFHEAGRKVIDQWLHNNVEDKAHTCDEQCAPYVNNGCCPVCNVGHGRGCLVCGGTGFHKPGCKESDAEGSVQENQKHDTED